ncbi:MAG: N-(5'-phosphoribosyl)anthranilate isomerase [Paracoccaceae bacterium]
MTHLPVAITPDHWIVQVFSARSAAEGGIVRRQVADVERLVGRDRFLKEIHKRGYRAVENAGQIIVFCNSEPVQLLR